MRDVELIKSRYLYNRPGTIRNKCCSVEQLRLQGISTSLLPYHYFANPQMVHHLPLQNLMSIEEKN